MNKILIVCYLVAAFFGILSYASNEEIEINDIASRARDGSGDPS